MTYLNGKPVVGLSRWDGVSFVAGTLGVVGDFGARRGPSIMILEAVRARSRDAIQRVVGKRVRFVVKVAAATYTGEGYVEYWGYDGERYGLTLDVGERPVMRRVA